MTSLSPGDRLVAVFPGPRMGDVIEVESLLEPERAVIRRANGARQSFHIATLTDSRYWLPEERDPKSEARDGEPIKDARVDDRCEGMVTPAAGDASDSQHGRLDRPTIYSSWTRPWRR